MRTAHDIIIGVDPHKASWTAAVMNSKQAQSPRQDQGPDLFWMATGKRATSPRPGRMPMALRRQHQPVPDRGTLRLLLWRSTDRSLLRRHRSASPLPAGDRTLNHALHMMAITQVRSHPDGRAYYQRKRAAGKSHHEAVRCLKRRLVTVIYRTMATDAASEGGPGRTIRGVSDIQRGRLNPDSQLFGEVTSRARPNPI